MFSPETVDMICIVRKKHIISTKKLKDEVNFSVLKLVNYMETSYFIQILEERVFFCNSKMLWRFFKQMSNLKWYKI